MDVKSTTETRQYLTFILADELFALDVSNVREILQFSEITKVPKTPDFMRGVINLRGGVVPVLDMRLRLGMTRQKETVDTCIIVIEANFEGEDLMLGILVDSVQEVFDMASDLVEPPPKFGTRFKTGFIKSMGKRDDQLIIMLDIDKVIYFEDISVKTTNC